MEICRRGATSARLCGRSHRRQCCEYCLALRRRPTPIRNFKRHYQRFGPDAPPHAVEAAQREAFADIRTCIDGLRREIIAGSATSPSVLKHLVETKSDDDTALGNLIFLFEPSHFDVYSLWHWLLYYLAKNNHVADRIAEALAADRVEADKLVSAAILETLRLNQSEVLYRQAADDIVFDGQFMPKGEVVRVCLWEGHKDEGAFRRSVCVPAGTVPGAGLQPRSICAVRPGQAALYRRRPDDGADVDLRGRALPALFLHADRGRAAHARRVPLGAGRRQPDFVVVAPLNGGYRSVAGRLASAKQARERQLPPLPRSAGKVARGDVRESRAESFAEAARAPA